MTDVHKFNGDVYFGIGLTILGNFFVFDVCKIGLMQNRRASRAYRDSV